MTTAALPASNVKEREGATMTETVTVPPMDEHNRRLVGNVHPPDWANPKPSGRYNLVVIGAGTAGLVTAAGAAGLGAKVALVERNLMGGDCLNVGCVPSKCLIRSSRAAAAARGGAEFGVHVRGDVEVDFPAVMERMREIRAGISFHDSAQRFTDEYGIDIFLGDARFAGPDTVEVGGQSLRFKKAVIATGGRPVHPPVEGLAETGFLTNETVFQLTGLPKDIVVIGAGPIGCELAQAFGRFGSNITIVEQGPQFLAKEDPDAAAILHESFRKDGINVLLETTATKVAVSERRKIVHLRTGEREHTVTADEILVGVGRRPNVEGLGLENVGVKCHEHGIVVDDRLRTTNSRIYACGDVCMRHKFTHTADAAARIVIQNALFFGRKKLSALTVPWCTYTDPEIAHVGLYGKEAEDRGIPAKTFLRKFEDVDRALADGEENGLVKIHVKEGSDEILGATIVARHAGEMISEITLAIVAGAGLGTIAGVIHPYPTQADAIRQLGDQYNRTRLTPVVKGLFERFLSWTR